MIKKTSYCDEGETTFDEDIEDEVGIDICRYFSRNQGASWIICNSQKIKHGINEIWTIKLSLLLNWCKDCKVSDGNAT